MVYLHGFFHWPFLFCILLHFAVQCSLRWGSLLSLTAPSGCRSHCVPCCLSVSISASRRCLRRTSFEAIHCSTYGFCTLIPVSFYTSFPFQGSSAYPQTWKPLHTSKSIVLYTAQVLPSLQILYKMWQEVLGVIFEHGESSRGKKLVLIYLCSLYQVRSCAERGKEGTGNCLG